MNTSRKRGSGMNRPSFCLTIGFAMCITLQAMEPPPPNLPDDPFTTTFISESAARLEQLNELVDRPISISDPMGNHKQFMQEWTDIVDDQIQQINLARRQCGKICKAAFQDRASQRECEEQYLAWLRDGGDQWTWLRSGGLDAFWNIKVFELLAGTATKIDTPAVAASLVWYVDAATAIDDFMERAGYDSRGGKPGGGDLSQVQAEVQECQNHVYLAKVLADCHAKMVRAWQKYFKDHDPERTTGHQSMYDSWGLTPDSVFFPYQQHWLEVMAKHRTAYIKAFERLHVVWDPIEMETFLSETDHLSGWTAKDLPRGMQAVLANHKNLLYQLQH